MTRIATLAAALFAAGACAPSATGDPEAAAAGNAATQPAATATSEADGSLRLTIRLSPGGPEILSSATSGEPVQRRDPYRNEPTFFRVYDGEGGVLAERGFKLETELRSEIPAADGALSGERVPLDVPVVTLQIPRFESAAVVRLYLRGEAEPELLAEVRP